VKSQSREASGPEPQGSPFVNSHDGLLYLVYGQIRVERTLAQAAPRDRKVREAKGVKRTTRNKKQKSQQRRRPRRVVRQLKRGNRGLCLPEPEEQNQAVRCWDRRPPFPGSWTRVAGGER
jgi:hypothetical protein